jgi:hypothetical protein
MEMRREVLFTKDEKGLTVKAYGCRASYSYLNNPDESKKYRSQFCLPKDTKGIEDLKTAIMEYGRARFPGQKWVSAAMKDGDKMIEENVSLGVMTKEQAETSPYKNAYVLSGSTYADKVTGKAPDVRGDCYSGSYVATVLRVVTYDTVDEKGGKAIGVHAYINGVVKQADGERLGGDRLNADALGLDPLEGVEEKPKTESKDYSDVPF